MVEYQYTLDEEAHETLQDIRENNRDPSVNTVLEGMELDGVIIDGERFVPEDKVEGDSDE